jgi:hypothetical protein
MGTRKYSPLDGPIDGAVKALKDELIEIGKRIAETERVMAEFNSLAIEESIEV